MKKFKKIYIEITNVCNLNCSFCPKTERKQEFISIDKFEKIIKGVKEYTETIYLHVKGEPLLHPNLKEILNICDRYEMKVNLTTNGMLLKDKITELVDNKCLRKINVSLHCENNKSNYYEDVFEAIDEYLKDKTIVYRIWTLENGKLDEKSTEIVEKLKDNYKLSTETVEKINSESNIKLAPNIYLDKDNKFEWPTEEKINNHNGFCMALKTQIAILVDGTVVPCCLDGEGKVVLGNILENNLEEILNSNRYKALRQSFIDRKPCEQLCKNCTYKDRFN